MSDMVIRIVLSLAVMAVIWSWPWGSAPADIPVITLLKTVGRVTVNDDADFRARYGNVMVSCNAGDISADHGKYYVAGIGTGDSVEEAAEDCLRDFAARLLKQPQRAREIEAREAAR